MVLHRPVELAGVFGNYADEQTYIDFDVRCEN